MLSKTLSIVIHHRNFSQASTRVMSGSSSERRNSFSSRNDRTCCMGRQPLPDTHLHLSYSGDSLDVEGLHSLLHEPVHHSSPLSCLHCIAVLLVSSGHMLLPRVLIFRPGIDQILR